MKTLKNTSSSYGIVTRLLHWVMAITIFGMFALGVWMRTLGYYDSWYKLAPDLHRSMGIVLVGLLIARLAWRLANVQPVDAGHKPLERRIATVVHWLFYVALAALFAAGYLISTADGRSIDVFGLFEVQSIIKSPGLEQYAGLTHKYVAWGLMFLVGAHILAALKHHFVDRDKTLVRMISGSVEPKPDVAGTQSATVTTPNQPKSVTRTTL